MKIGYQLKQVRERLAKGLVDKGILRTEKRNFLLFDMATHPVADGGAKEEIRRRVRNVLTQRTVVLTGSQFLPENLEFRYLRTIAMVCAAYAANVLENALSTLGHEARERAFAQTDELLAEYSQWPFGRKATQNGIGANLPLVIGEVSFRLRLSSWPYVHKLTQIRSTGGHQGEGQGTSARSRRRLLERLYSP
jgi:Golgi phosphoprotein 3